MKTKEQILLNHLQQHGCLDAEDLSERLAAGQFQPEFDAMDEYAKDVADAKDAAYVLLGEACLRRAAAEMRVNFLTSEVERLKQKLDNISENYTIVSNKGLAELNAVCHKHGFAIEIQILHDGTPDIAVV